MNIMYIKFYKV